MNTFSLHYSRYQSLSYDFDLICSLNKLKNPTNKWKKNNDVFFVNMSEGLEEIYIWI